MSNIPNFPPGWKVFPCAANGKEPVAGFINWPSLATDDPIQIAEWAAEYPGCNWAVAVGASGLGVIDIDPPIGEDSLMLLELEHGALPDTREHSTPRGGRHIIYSDPDRTLAITASTIAPKIDTRGGANGKDSYIIIPPSKIGENSYGVLLDREPASLPSFLADLAGRRRESVGASNDIALDDPANVERAASLLRDYVARGDVAREGSGGDNRTYQVAAELLNFGLSEDQAFHLISEIWNPACEPPWAEDELRAKIENAARYAQNEPGAWAVPPASAVLTGDTLDRLAAQDTTPEQGGRAPRFNWRTEAELRDVEPLPWLLEDILYRETITMMFGPSGHYKTFLALHLGMTLAVRGECVFYVAGEGDRRMAARDVPAWRLANGVEGDLPFHMVDDMPLATDPDDYAAFVDSIRRKAAGRPIGAVFLDTLNIAMLGLEENSAKDASVLLAAAKAVKRSLRCMVMLIHHTPDADQHKARGSSAFYAGFDTVLRVQADTKVKLARLYVQKQKNGEAREAPLHFEGRKFGPGLAFIEIEARKAALMSAEADIFHPRSISAVLRKLGAFEPEFVTSDVLASELVPALEGESMDERNDIVARVRKGLMAAAKGDKLAGFYKGEGRGIKWCLPSPPHSSPE